MEKPPHQKESHWTRPWIVLVGAFGFGTAVVTAWAYLSDKPEIGLTMLCMCAAFLFLGSREHRKGIEAVEKRVRDELQAHVTTLEGEKAHLEHRLRESENEIKLMREGEAHEVRQRKETLGEVIKTTEQFESHVDRTLRGQSLGDFRGFSNLIQYGLPDDERYMPLKRALEKAQDFANNVLSPPSPMYTPRPAGEGVIDYIDRGEHDAQRIAAETNHMVYSNGVHKQTEKIVREITDRAEALLAAP